LWLKNQAKRVYSLNSDGSRFKWGNIQLKSGKEELLLSDD